MSNIPSNQNRENTTVPMPPAPALQPTSLTPSTKPASVFKAFDGTLTQSAELPLLPQAQLISLTTQETVLETTEKIDRLVETWHLEWAEPLAITGEMPPIDPTLKNYVPVIASAAFLFRLYQDEHSELDTLSKLKITSRIREELKSISQEQIDFSWEQLIVMKTKVSEAKTAFENAKNAFLHSKGDEVLLTKNYCEFHKTLAALNYTKEQCSKMQTALRGLLKELKVKPLPSPIASKEEGDGWIQSIWNVLSHPITSLSKALVSGTEERLADKREQFEKEYNTLSDRVADDLKTVTELVAECAVTESDISQCNDYLAAQLHMLGGKTSFLDWLPIDGTSFEEERLQDVSSYYEYFKEHEVELLKKFSAGGEEGSTPARIQALNLFFLALFGISGAQSVRMMMQQGENIARQAVTMSSEIRQAIPEQIQKAGSFLGQSLQDKIGAIKKMNDEEFTRYTKKFPETRDLLNQYRSGQKSQPSATEISDLQSAFMLANIPHQVSPYSSMSVDDWMRVFTGEKEAGDAQRAQVTVEPTPAESATAATVPHHTATPIREEHIVTPLEDLQNSVQVSAATRTHQQFFLFSLISSMFGLLKYSQTTPKAEPLDYGNKHKHIVELHHAVASFGIEDVEVPLPFGIASQHVQKFLQTQNSPIFTQWESLAKQFEIFKEKEKEKSAAEFLEKPEVIETLKKIQGEIQQTFEAAAKNPALLNQIPEAQSLITWLGELHARNAYIMVRSTGQEDSKVSNAGGNRSESYVTPTIDKALKNIGVVIQSYFSTESLKNLLNANQNPFEGPLHLAVTLQELIGEPVGGASDPQSIPLSVVLFSNEPYYSGTQLGAPFRVLRLSGSYGHGEGVVGMRGVPTDTVLVLQSKKDPKELYVLYDNQEKPQRLAPVRDASTGKVFLELVDNPDELQQSRAFDLPLITRLFSLAVNLEEFFGYPVDSELVVKNNKVHIVQARSVNREEATPTYIDTAKISQYSSEPSKMVQAKVVVPGHTSALVVRSKEQVLVASTLEEAQKLYNEHQHDLIIIAQDEPANSHPVVNFSGLGVAVLYYKNSNEVTQLLQPVGSNGEVLCVCMQEGTLTPWNEKVTSAQNLVSNGYVAHPAPIALSLSHMRQPPTLSGKTKLYIPPDLKKIFYLIRTEATQEVALEAIYALARHPFLEEVSKRAQEIKARDSTGVALSILEAAQSVESATQGAFDELIATFSDSSTTRLERLLKIKVVENLLLATCQDGAVSCLSHVHIQEAFAAADLMHEYQKGLTKPALFAEEALYMQYAVGAEQEQEWLKFLQELEEAAVPQEELIEFKKFIIDINQRGLMPLWMNIIFAPQRQEYQKQEGTSLTGLLYALFGPCSDQQELMKQLKAQYDEKTQVLVKHIEEQKRAIKATQKSLSAFSESTTLPAAFESLKKLSMDFLSRCTKPYHEASLLGKLTLIQAMTDIVDVYDTAIKTMKSSQHIDTQTKVKFFREMLKPYSLLLRTWATKIVAPDSFYFPSPLGSIGALLGFSWDLNSYLDELEKRVDTLWHGDNERLLLPSPGFSVEAAVLGSGAAFSRHLPDTLEDVFTTYHQDLLACISQLSGELISIGQLMRIPFPEHFKNALIGVESFRSSVRRIGLQFTESQLTIHYNIPLRNHSAKLILTYDENSDTTTARLEFLGPARNRWEILASYTNALGASGEFSLTQESRYTGQMLETNWIVPQDPKKLEALLSLWNRMLDYTLIRGFSSFELFSHGEINKFISVIENADETNSTITGLIKAVISMSPKSLSSVARLTKLIKLHAQSDERIADFIANMLHSYISQGTQTDLVLPLVEKLAGDQEAYVRNCIVSRLLSLMANHGIRTDLVLKLAEKLTDDQDAGVREKMVWLLRDMLHNKIGTDLALKLVEKLAGDQDATVRSEVEKMKQLWYPRFQKS